MSPKTAAAIAEIKAAISAGQTRIAPATFSHCYGRAATSAAFRVAKAQGLIEVAYTSCAGTPVYQAAGIKNAASEAAGATKR
jgi:hypothetical protein